MVYRVVKELVNEKQIVVINDEAHHCYEPRLEGESKNHKLKNDEINDIEQNNRTAHLWINGVRSIKKFINVSTIYDLSATPFFIRGSGWNEGSLFPWTVSDFSIVDAIESGLVKLPRIPIADDSPEEFPIYRYLWDYIGTNLPKKASLNTSSQRLPDKLISALKTLYGHYEKQFRLWKETDIRVPPVFIVVCNNTTTSKIVYEWISGWEEKNSDSTKVIHQGNLQLFNNYDECNNARSRPNTILIDSRQIESGTIDLAFKKIASSEIAQFKRERALRGDISEISDSELLREVMNTIGKKDKLGEQVRCVVSVSMLTEGWDANTVTHILGVRAFGSQLLCEQVVGRGLRRLTYELSDKKMFDTEYVEVIGIPFAFIDRPTKVKPVAPKEVKHVRAIESRKHLEIMFPNIAGYQTSILVDNLVTNFSENISTLTVDKNLLGPSETIMSGIRGKKHTVTLTNKDERISTTIYKLAQKLIKQKFLDIDGNPKLFLFTQALRICREWVESGYLRLPKNIGPWILSAYENVSDKACDKIFNSIVQSHASSDTITVPIFGIDQSKVGTSSTVDFYTSRKVKATDQAKSHVNYAVCDSSWEEEFVDILHSIPSIYSYIKNTGLGFKIPYTFESTMLHYEPDFIVQTQKSVNDVEIRNVIVEIKGFKDQKSFVKESTARNQWVPCVNSCQEYGQWQFVQFDDIRSMKKQVERFFL